MHFATKLHYISSVNIQSIIKELQLKGCKSTPLRKAILEILLESNSPISAIYLMEKLKLRDFSPNKTTVYRQLATLVEHGVVETVNLDSSMQMFELHKGHHHHFVCDSCDTVIDVEAPEVESALHAFERELSHRNLRVTKHEFALYGLCSMCS